MKKLISFVVLWSVFLLLVGSQVKAQSTETVLELTIYQVVITDGVASITGPASSSQVELYDNLGEKLLDNGTTGPDGMISFTLDDRYSLSGKGLFHAVIKVDGVSNGDITCQQGQNCPVTVFTVEGLDPDLDDALLIVKVVRSSDLHTPVEGIKLIVTRADAAGVPEPTEKIFTGKWDKYSSPIYIYKTDLPCISNLDGYCVTYLNSYYRFIRNSDDQLEANTTIGMGRHITYDASSVKVYEGEVRITTIAVDEKGKLDDCIFRPAPLDKILNPSCMDKVHQTATAQARITVDPFINEAINNAIVQANQMSKDTMDLFAAHEANQNIIDEFIKNAEKDIFDQSKQVKLVLYVNKIKHDEFDASIEVPAIGKTVEITHPENPDILLGACKVNSLGECVSIIDRSAILAPDGLLKFRVIVEGDDRYDNGILLCRDEPICEQHVYTVIGLTNANDAIVLLKVVRDDNYLTPVKGTIIRTGKNRGRPYLDNTGQVRYPVVYRECTSDEFGACPLYIDDQEYIWTDINGELVGQAYAWIGGKFENDLQNLNPKDNRLVVVYLAVNVSGKLVDCSFTSPLSYSVPSSICAAKEKAMLTAIAGYTTTPTVTITPTVTVTPTVTATPLPSLTPTATLIPSPTPKPGLIEGKPASVMIGGGLLLAILLCGGAWLILRARRK